MPTNGHKIINDHGTAPGAWFEDAQGHCAALMPGVPREMKAMWLEQVRPLLLARQNCTIHSHTLRVLGGESAIASKVAPLFESTNPTAAIYCKTGECEIRVTARETTPEAAEAACRERLEEFRRILGDAAYDVDVPALEYTVVRVLREKGLHAATAESCTGGMIAERLTNVPGSSEPSKSCWASRQRRLHSTTWFPAPWLLPWPLARRKNPARSWPWVSPAWPDPEGNCPASRWARSTWLAPTPAPTRAASCG